MPDVENINLSKIIKRLELIKSLISLEEEDEIDAHVIKLQQFGKVPELETIILSLKERSYSKAAIAIDQFLNRHNNLSIFIDPANKNWN